MVPGSMLMYGSSFRIETGTPRALRIRPMEAAVMAWPRELVTPPVTKTYLGIVPNLSPVDSSVRSGRRSGAPFGQHASEGRQHLLGTRVYRTGRTDGEPLVAPRTAGRMIVAMKTIFEDPFRRACYP